jgi:hypothetical protein
MKIYVIIRKWSYFRCNQLRSTRGRPVKNIRAVLRKSSGSNGIMRVGDNQLEKCFLPGVTGEETANIIETANLRKVVVDATYT